MKKLMIAIVAITAINAANVEASYLWDKAKAAASSAKNTVKSVYHSAKDKIKGSDTAQKVVDDIEKLTGAGLKQANAATKKLVAKAVEKGSAATVTLINLKLAEKGYPALSQSVARTVASGVSKAAAAGAGLAVEATGKAAVGYAAGKFRPAKGAVEEEAPEEENEYEGIAELFAEEE